MPSPGKAGLVRLFAGVAICGLVGQGLAPATGQGEDLPHSPVHYQMFSSQSASWARILESAGFQRAKNSPAGIVVNPAADAEAALAATKGRQGQQTRSSRPAEILAVSSADDWLTRVGSGTFLVLEGDTALSRTFGFRATASRTRVASIVDLRQPNLPIVWEKPVEIPVFELPAGARLFVREKWQGAPLVAGVRRGQGDVLWTAISPGDNGYERFPYLLHALADLGVAPPFQSRRLWAFFDPSYRLRADTDYLARRWRSAGLAALHVAAWPYFDADPAKEEYLTTLIDSCHRHGILVYAWLELPHVSERFWEEHPEWREKTALLQDAHLDWRKLMNLANGFCFRAAAQGVRRLMDRFDWDGINLAELYFESLQGHANPSRFTPFNDDVRREFRVRHGFDPIGLFQRSTPPQNLRLFLEYRAELVQRLQAQWMAEADELRRSKPDLDVVLTHVDDRFDARMRDAIGADAAWTLSQLGGRDFTILVEDPATVWNLGPGRYTQIAARYKDITPRPENLAIDINIVERYQDVYPTKQQTGAELLQLVHTAAHVFPRVALYFEHSILAPDVPWLPSAAATVDRFEREGARTTVESRHGVGIPWDKPAWVDGRLWPAWDGTTLWLPPGQHVVEAARTAPNIRLLDFTGELMSAEALPGSLAFAYRASARALAVLDRKPGKLDIDGVRAELRAIQADGRCVLFLPPGQHVVTLRVEPD